MEVLAVVAYNQPVTRAFIDAVRGVDSAYTIAALLRKKLIEENGRLNAPGRPILYRTTPDFLRTFGLESLEDLPEMEKVQFSTAAEVEDPAAAGAADGRPQDAQAPQTEMEGVLS